PLGGVVAPGVLRQALLRYLGGEQQHWQILAELAFLDLPAQYEAGLIGQLCAQDDQIRSPLLQFSVGIRDAVGHGGLVACDLEHRGHAQGKVILALDDQYSAVHAGSWEGAAKAASYPAIARHGKERRQPDVRDVARWVVLDTFVRQTPCKS